MNLEQIKNEYAVSAGYYNWSDLDYNVNDSEDFDEHFKNVCVLAQKECLKRASENAWNGYVVTGMQSVADDVKQSITNENNIIK